MEVRTRCLICLKVAEPIDSFLPSAQAVFTDLFNVLCKYVDVLKAPLLPNHHPFPFCKSCRTFVVQIHKIHTEMERLEWEIHQIVNSVCAKILESRGANAQVFQRGKPTSSPEESHASAHRENILSVKLKAKQTEPLEEIIVATGLTFQKIRKEIQDRYTPTITLHELTDEFISPQLDTSNQPLLEIIPIYETDDLDEVMTDLRQTDPEIYGASHRDFHNYEISHSVITVDTKRFPCNDGASDTTILKRRSTARHDNNATALRSSASNPVKKIRKKYSRKKKCSLTPEGFTKLSATTFSYKGKYFAKKAKKGYKCGTCNTVSVNLKSLKYHIHARHTGDITDNNSHISMVVPTPKKFMYWEMFLENVLRKKSTKNSVVAPTHF